MNRDCKRKEKGYYSISNTNIASVLRSLTKIAAVFVKKSDQGTQGPNFYVIIFPYNKAPILIICQHVIFIERLVTTHTSHTVHSTSQSSTYLIWRHKEKTYSRHCLSDVTMKYVLQTLFI